MAMRTFSHFEKSKNQFQLIRHFTNDKTLVFVFKPAKTFTICVSVQEVAFTRLAIPGNAEFTLVNE
jgi:hypothetical protein